MISHRAPIGCLRSERATAIIRGAGAWRWRRCTIPCRARPRRRDRRVCRRHEGGCCQIAAASAGKTCRDHGRETPRLPVNETTAANAACRAMANERASALPRAKEASSRDDRVGEHGRRPGQSVKTTRQRSFRHARAARFRAWRALLGGDRLSHAPAALIGPSPGRNR
jgi:hypothetical protein